VAAPPVGSQFLSTFHGNWRSLVPAALRFARGVWSRRW
jgi:hypothetical protein